MPEETPRFWEIFFELYEGLPRQGPGNRASAARALDLCRELPTSPVVLDLGCGVGGQTLHLVELTHGWVVALVWSEGALYNVDIENALRICHGLLRPGGYLVFTDAVWRKDDPPPEVKASFDLDYPTMGRVTDILAAIRKTGLSLVDHFTLPAEAWWDDFYTPMERRIAELRGRYSRRRRGARGPSPARSGARDAPATLGLLRVRVLRGTPPVRDATG